MTLRSAVLSLILIPGCSGPVGNGSEAASTPGSGDPAPSAVGGRLAPPAALECDRNRLTSFSGTVADYERSDERIALTVETDAGTVEEFVLTFDRAVGPWSHFLLRGEPYPRGEWDRIEEAPSRLHPDLGIIVWVCRGDPDPVFDWRPGESGHEMPRAT